MSKKSAFKQQLKINGLCSKFNPPTTNEILIKMGLDTEIHKIIGRTCDNIKILNLINNKTLDIYY
ncbi:hypothetical protein AB2T90_20960 [Clostridium butyricum]|uniref:hypothetical protein n=1 Tax=Clostridium butyricum TaxID=1492 RepID=UPI00346582F1